MQRIWTNLQRKATNTEFCKFAGHKVNIQYQLHFYILVANKLKVKC